MKIETFDDLSNRVKILEYQISSQVEPCTEAIGALLARIKCYSYLNPSVLSKGQRIFVRILILNMANPIFVALKGNKSINSSLPGLSTGDHIGNFKHILFRAKFSLL